jgi:hypothetical protein
MNIDEARRIIAADDAGVEHDPAVLLDATAALIRRVFGSVLGRGDTESEAWADAARRLKP